VIWDGKHWESWSAFGLSILTVRWYQVKAFGQWQLAGRDRPERLEGVVFLL
jgi:hypothetical protein